MLNLTNARARRATRRARRAAIRAEHRRALAEYREHQESLTIRHDAIGVHAPLPPVDGPYATERELLNA